MNNSELLKEIEKLKLKISELENSCIDKQEYIRWRARPKEDYWFIDCLGDITDDYENHEERDNFRYSIGNYFQTQQEAQEYKENLITKQKLKDLALRLNEGVEIDWNDIDQYKFSIVFDNMNETLYQIPNSDDIKIGNIYCLDVDFLKIAKEEIGEEALIKLIKSGA